MGQNVNIEQGETGNIEWGKMKSLSGENGKVYGVKWKFRMGQNGHVEWGKM